MWLPRSAYRQLLRTVAEERRRARRAENALELERHENRAAERHWANMLLRAKQSYPMQTEKPKPVEQPLILEPVIDPGIVEAHRQFARDHGIDLDVEQFLKREQ